MVGNLYVEVTTVQRAVAGELRGQINNQARCMALILPSVRFQSSATAGFREGPFM